MKSGLKLGMLLLAAVGMVSELDAGLRERRIIAHGWDLLWADTDDLARNREQLVLLPVDGLTVAVKRDIPGEASVNFLFAMGAEERWKPEWLAGDGANLRSLAQGGLKHNFLTTMLAAGRRLRWDDDHAWGNVVHNFGVMAGVARDGEARGLLFDPEDYAGAHQFRWSEADGSYEETARLARRRGAQLMEAIAQEYPDITILAFWLFSMHQHFIYAEAPAEAERAAGDLWFPFLNGMLDALPPEATLIDANEWGYFFEGSEFFERAIEVKDYALDAVAPENHSKYRNQVRTGFGLYLDMYTNSPDRGAFYSGEWNGSRLNRLCRNLSFAMKAADGYCWFYGEAFRWVDWDWGTADRAPAGTWEEQLPGFQSAVKFMRTPFAVGREIWETQRREGTLVNLVVNPKCDPAYPAVERKNSPYWTWEWGNLPAGWGFWQMTPVGREPGTFEPHSAAGADDRFCAKATGVFEGCFMVSIPVEPGQWYAVEAFASGVRKPTTTVRFMNSGRFMNLYCGIAVDPGNANAPDGWQRLFGIVEVPEGAEELLLLMNCNLAPGDSIRYDNPGIFRLF